VNGSVPAWPWLVGVVSFCILMNMLSRGYGETFAVFLLPLGQEFGWSRTTLTGAYSTYLIGYGLCAPLAGQLFARAGPRVTYVFGLACLGSGYSLASYAESTVGLYLTIGVLGALGAASIGMVPASALIRRWFPGNLTTALGFAYAGLGGGVLVFAPSAQLLIEAAGWRYAYAILGVLPVVLVPVVALLPWRILAVGRTATDAQAAAVPEDPQWTLTRAVRTAPFWGLFLSFVGTSGGYFILMPQLVAYFVDLGYAPLQAAGAFGVIGMLSVIGMVGVAIAADRYGGVLVVTISYVASIAGVLVFWVLGFHPSHVVLGTALLLFGITAGCRAPIITEAAARLFPGRGYAAVSGGLNAGMGIGAGCGSLLGAFIHDATNSYVLLFPISVLLLAIAAGMFWFIKPLRVGHW
jgi:MFS family permease